MIPLFPPHPPLKVHFIGLAGSGMSGLAEILHQIGHQVAGSDLSYNRTVERLQALSIQVAIGHDAQLVHCADLVVVSSAIPEDNAELQQARLPQKKICTRGQLLAELATQFQQTIVIAGTHGKTTTTAMLIELLMRANLMPSYLIGGELNLTKNNGALHPNSSWMIMESDESDGSFLLLKPYIGVITNIDNDHLNHYGNQLSQLLEAFQQFILNIQAHGYLIVYWNNSYTQKIVSEVLTLRPDLTILTYGLNDDAQIYPTSIRYTEASTHFSVGSSNQSQMFELKAYGQHNVLNALVSLAVTQIIEQVTLANLQLTLKHYAGVKRRFQISQILNSVLAKKFMLIEDYAHHPTELVATYTAVKNAFPSHDLITIFQPHKYSRTKNCYEEFLQCLGQMQELWLLDIYPAGEEVMPDLHSDMIVRDLQQQYPSLKVRYLAQQTQVLQLLDDRNLDSHIVLCLGAGSIGQLPQMIQHHYLS